jgi:hypothetical protein
MEGELTGGLRLNALHPSGKNLHQIPETVAQRFETECSSDWQQHCKYRSSFWLTGGHVLVLHDWVLAVLWQPANLHLQLSQHSASLR